MSRVFASLFPWRLAMRSLCVALVYFAASALAIHYTRFGGGPACLWIATAILIAELVQQPPRSWGWSTVGAMIAGIVASGLFGIGFAGAPLVTLFIVAEAGLAAWLLRRWSGAELGTLPGVLVFIAVAGILAPAISGLGGAVAIAAMTGKAFAANWVSWYLGHALGNITVTPIALLVLSGEGVAGIAKLRWARKLEGVVLTLLTFGVSHMVFRQTTFPLLFLPLLPLTIAAFRFDRLGGAIAITIVATLGAVFTIGGDGPIHLISGGTFERALFLQFYLATAVVMTLLISAELGQRKGLVVALRESEARYRLIADGSTDVILTLTLDGRIDYASPSIVELGGYDPASLIGAQAKMLVRPEDRARVAQAHRKALADPASTFIVEYCGVQHSGAMIWCESHTRGITDEDNVVVGAVSVVRDISRHKKVEADLARAAQTDPLTGIVNRRAFDAALDQRLIDVAEDRGAGVCAVLDLDFFKLVNDRHGHAAGDKVLCVFADVVRRSLRGGDLVARMGGEEFALILWDTELTEAHRICDRLRREIADLSVATGLGHDVRFTFSGGLARIGAGQSRQHVLREADEALYRAKHAGRNRLEMAA
uniref:sensor domain-containing diguanylate cyclase n=1 Tax=uncultured Sphingomonas sp. TaxID=158754 RepID=UPI0035CC49CC